MNARRRIKRNGDQEKKSGEDSDQEFQHTYDPNAEQTSR